MAESSTHSEEENLDLVEAPHRVAGETLSYARVAKKIDVIAIKSAMSRQLNVH